MTVHFGFDLETGTTERMGYNPVLQLGGVSYKESGGGFEPVGEMDVRARAGRHYVSPVAMAVNGLSGDSAGAVDPLKAATQAHFGIEGVRLEAMGDVRVFGFNSASFDDPVLRHWLYANGRNPWLMASDYDALLVLRLGHMVGSEGVSVSVGESGKPEFSLQALRGAAGLDGLDALAHESKGDVEVTMRLLERFKSRDSATHAQVEALMEPGWLDELIDRGRPVASIPLTGGSRALLPFRSEYGDMAVDLQLAARLEKFMNLPDDEVAGMMGRPAAERPAGWRSASGGNVPFRRLRASTGKAFCLLDGDGGTPAATYPFRPSEAQREMVAKSMEVIEKHGAEAVQAKVASALSARLPYEEAPGVESRGLGVKLSADDHLHRAEVAEREGDIESVAEAAALMSSDLSEHVQLFALWKGDRNPNWADDPKEALVYQAALEDRFRNRDGTVWSCSERAEAEVEKLRTSDKGGHQRLYMECADQLDAGLEGAKALDAVRAEAVVIAKGAQAACGMTATEALDALVEDAVAVQREMASQYGGPGR